MRFTPMFKHTKSMKEDIMIEITWLSYDFLFCQHLCTLVRRVPGISFLILHCLALVLTSGRVEISKPGRDIIIRVQIPAANLHCTHVR